MAEVEVEEFGITDWDLENEFNPNRVRHKQSREEQIYGVWAERSTGDDEEDANDVNVRPSFSGAARRATNENILFVSESTPKNTAFDQNLEDNDAAVIEVHAPTKKGRNQTGPLGIFASERSALGSSIGSWEKHTKGIGAKLLLKMGYQPGRGLGKDLQGISAPVEATFRKGKGAIGAYGPEKPAHKIPKGGTGNVDDLEIKQKREANQWKRGEKKVKYVYKSIEEVQKEGTVFHERQSGPKVKVIDMTGPEQRVLSGYHQLSQQHHRPDDEILTKGGSQGNFCLPELEENLDVLIDTCETDIKRNLSRIESERNRITTLRFEQERLVREREESERVVETMTKLSDTLRDLEQNSGPNAVHPLSVGEVCMIFRKLVEDFDCEFRQFELFDLAPMIIFPLMKDYVSTWLPLENPKYGIEVFRQWKAVLGRSERPQNSPDYYYNLMWEVWCPIVRTTVFRWSPRNPEPLVSLLEVWRPLIPPAILCHLLEQIILPRVHQEVDAWNPLLDTVPIHTWVHPWLALTPPHSLEPIFQPIRMKLGHALANWHPSDASAKLIIEPWVGVMSRSALDAFIASNIIPKLGAVLQRLAINPRNQELEPWQWFTAWGDIAPVPALVAVLEKYFFPQFHQVLFQWLQTSRSYDEIATWFSGWKAAFPDRVLEEGRIREQFRQALDLMNRAVSGQHPLQPVRPIDFYPPGPALSPGHQPTRQARHTNAVSSLSGAHGFHLSFKEILERRASEKGVLFMPIANRKQDGKQVYQLGNDRMLYLDRSVIFVFNGRTWVPTSMDSLLDSCV